ncbi:hypothetical protein B0A49_02044 [Cryomyces minteri]|uniref:SAP domain-containing protein n=1 Tax=Cryomyces minteri TaxID=331657 RepID=A0A4U0XSD1_9PEZI|nr:hypothetical protein B0A49_02044 [Cryomyces minteri]
MAAPRVASFRTLRSLAASTQVRQLHMTGPATFPSPLLTSERPAINLPRDTAGLRAECKKRGLDVTGSKHELMSRLNAHELTHSQAFCTALDQTTRLTAASSVAGTPVRHFNTSRSLKAVGDTSTIDFAFLPDFDPENPEVHQVRVPLLPTNFFPPRNGVHAHEAVEQEVMRPTISTASADNSAVSALSDVHDNAAMPIDFHAMAEKITSVTEQLKSSAIEEPVGMVRQVWNGFLEDLMGPRKKGESAA